MSRHEQAEDRDEPSALAAASQRMAAGDADGGEAVLNRLIEREPRTLRGHIRKAAFRLRAGDAELARYFLRKTLSFVADRPRSTEEMAELEAARAHLAELETRADAERAARLDQRGLPRGQWSSRFAHALDIAAGRRTRFDPDPTAFFYPGLPTVQFFDPTQFAWARAVEAAAPAIRAELLALLSDGDERFRAYVTTDIGPIPNAGNRPLVGSKDWSVLALCENGFVDPEAVRRCPRTWETILACPVPRVSGWGPTITFSLLKAGAHIAPHTGMFNTRAICHLPLIVPPGCRFRVGDEVREWREGELLVFDDTIEHEAWNDGVEDRVVLIFDIWRPELSEQERLELTALFSD